jgi:hypothetical protein
MIRRGTRPAALLVALTLLTVACASPGSSSSESPTGGSTSGSQASVAPSGGVRDVSLSRLTDARATRRDAATIVIGFDAGAVAAMVTPAPSIDFATQALLCLHIGERSTGGWSVTIQSITVEGSEMAILAREVEPRPGVGVTQAFTYPADCAVIDRTMLPIGELMVRADDTTSDEFIVDAVVQVPAR